MYEAHYFTSKSFSFIHIEVLFIETFILFFLLILNLFNLIILFTFDVSILLAEIFYYFFIKLFHQLI